MSLRSNFFYFNRIGRGVYRLGLSSFIFLIIDEKARKLDSISTTRKNQCNSLITLCFCSEAGKIFFFGLASRPARPSCQVRPARQSGQRRRKKSKGTPRYSKCFRFSPFERALTKTDVKGLAKKDLDKK